METSFIQEQRRCWGRCWRYHRERLSRRSSCWPRAGLPMVSRLQLSARHQLIVDSESEVWMMTGLAVRMSIDLGLHLVSHGRVRPIDKTELTVGSTRELKHLTGRQTTEPTRLLVCPAHGLSPCFWCWAFHNVSCGRNYPANPHRRRCASDNVKHAGRPVRTAIAIPVLRPDDGLLWSLDQYAEHG